MIYISSFISLAFGLCLCIVGYQAVYGVSGGGSIDQNPIQGAEGFGYATYGDSKVYDKVKSEILPGLDQMSFSRATIAELSLSAAIFTFITAFFGLATVRSKKIYFACPFALLLLMTGTMLIIAGTVALGSSAEALHRRICLEAKRQTIAKS